MPVIGLRPIHVFGTNFMARYPALFMRIHKTAGEALVKQICDRLPADAVCPEEFEWQVRGLAAADLRRFSFFQGHISPASLSAVFMPLRVFTMLRSPRERLLSCFFYWKEGSKHARTKFFDALASMSLLDFLSSDDPLIRRVTWNVQARLLAGGQFGGVDEQRQAVFGPWLPEADLAETAIRALDRLAFVGTAERYELTLRMAYELLELGDPPLPERINVTATRPVSYNALLAVPPINDALSRLTAVDQVVYDEVRMRLDRMETGEASPSNSDATVFSGQGARRREPPKVAG